MTSHWPEDPGTPPPWPDPYQRRPVSIEAYAPPRQRRAIVWFLVAGVALAGIVLAVVVRGASAPLAASTPTPSASVSTAPGMPFVMPDGSRGTGRWEILQHEWSGSGVSLQLRVSADTGTVSYAFLAFGNASSEIFEPSPGLREPELTSGQLGAGESATGWLFLPMPRGAGTLILTTDDGRQVSALAIPA